MKISTILLSIIAFATLAFTLGEKELKFAYPKNKDATFFMTTNKFKDFKKEWQGADYYYLCESGEGGFICSVLFYKLSAEEQQMLVEMPRKMLDGPEVSPLYPQTYFTNYSKLKEYESNAKKWGEMTDDFMFSQADIKEFKGKKMDQKHMYGYAMFGKDMFVNIHLSKTDCTTEDSTAMHHILDGLRMKK